MKVLIVSASPKKRFSTSLYYSKVLKFWLIGHDVEIMQLHSTKDYNDIIEKLPETDVLIFACPVYVDAIPSTLLDYLCRASKDIGEKCYKLKVYGVNACGFYEGSQCELALEMFENWCIRTNLEWCGGIGIGAGEMLNILRINIPICLLSAVIGLMVRGYSLISGENSPLYGAFYGLFSMIFIITAVVYLLFSLGMFIGLFRLRNSIAHGNTSRNLFTTVWFCPRFLFVGFASLYWVLRALVCHRVPPWKLFRNKW